MQDEQLDDQLTIEEGTGTLLPQGPRVILVVSVERHDRSSRAVPLADGAEVTFGRSRGATVCVENAAVSRLHACIRRKANVTELEDLESRNGTFVNGARLASPRRLEHGDEIAIGPLRVFVCITSTLRARPRIATEMTAFDTRLAAELDRSLRYRRPLTVALLRIPDDAVDAVASKLRLMDLIAQDDGDDYLVLLPELGPVDGAAAIERLAALGRTCTEDVAAATASCPEDGTTSEELLRTLRERMEARPDRLVGTSDALVVHDPAMQRVYRLVRRVADKSGSVLIVGETGVGKECVAEALHEASTRRSGPLVRVHCGALAEEQLERQLFGYEHGAFAAANESKRGALEEAAGGTLFIDAIGAMPLTLQAKLLRVLERREIPPLGASTEVRVDVRIVAATHRPLVPDVHARRFRQDLLDRLSGITIRVPPLRERPRDIVMLAEHFSRLASNGLQRTAPAITAQAREVLLAYTWPGNVRELKNAIGRAVVLCDGALTVEDLPARLCDASMRLQPMPSRTVRGQLAHAERAAIVAALEAESNSQTRAARRLGISRRALIYKLEKHGLKAAPSR